VDTGHPLEAVLVEGAVVDVVVPAGPVGVGVGQRINIHQVLHVLVDGGSRNDAAGETSATVGDGVERGGRGAGSINFSELREFGGSKVTVAHAGGGYGSANETGVEDLVEVIVPGEEEELIAILVELRERD